jgi:CheY-like chemotaxis protein
MIHSAPPALLILDHQFTDTNGFEIVKKLDEQMGEQRIPIMILSADVGKSEKLAYNEMGIEYVFNKPVILSALKEAIDRLIHQM